MTIIKLEVIFFDENLTYVKYDFFIRIILDFYDLTNLQKWASGKYRQIILRDTVHLTHFTSKLELLLLHIFHRE